MRADRHREQHDLGMCLHPIAGAILLGEHIEEDGLMVFRHACRLGSEGTVLKRRDAPRSGRVKS